MWMLFLSSFNNFCLASNCGKICSTDSDFFLAYLVPLDVDVTGNITAKLCEVWSEFNIFCTLVTMATAAIFLISFIKLHEIS
jgi:hypothetical protein